jgi:hypothetical protein
MFFSFSSFGLLPSHYCHPADSYPVIYIVAISNFGLFKKTFRKGILRKDKENRKQTLIVRVDSPDFKLSRVYFRKPWLLEG